MSNDKECISKNLFEGDSDPDTEVDQMFGDDQEIELVDGEDMALNQEVEQLFEDLPEPVEEVAQNSQRCDEEVVGPLPAKEADNRWSIWDI